MNEGKLLPQTAELSSFRLVSVSQLMQSFASSESTTVACRVMQKLLVVNSPLEKHSA